MKVVKKRVDNVVQRYNIKPHKTAKNDDSVTIYRASEFGIGVIKYTGRLVKHGVREFAQYKHAPYVVFIQSGKRKMVRFIETSNPYLLIVKGKNTPNVPNQFDSVGRGFEESRYSSYDDRWVTDFNRFINPYINDGSVEVIADYRYIK